MRGAWWVLLAAACAGCGIQDGVDRRSAAGGPPSLAELEAMHADGPENLAVRYNLGTVLLRSERFEEARPHLEAAAAAESARVRQPAHFNRGNADLEPAFADDGDPQRRQALARAIDAYREALLLDPADADAKWNLELARRLLDRQPENSAAGGGGGGAGGGGGDEPQTGDRDPQSRPSGDRGPLPPLSPARAEEILSSAQLREVGLQREKLRKQQPRTRSAH